jgi:hypothetical protein
MDELVAHIVSKTGVDPEVARRAVAIILKFLLKDGPADKVQPLIDALPGGGVMGVYNALTSAGLDMGDIQNVTREFVAAAKTKVGADTVDQIVGSIPGLSQFV